MATVEDLLTEATAEMAAGDAGTLADALAAAVGAEGAKSNPEIATRTAELLALQIKRLRTQERHFEEEHRLELSHLRLRRLADYAKAAMQIVIALVVLALGFGVAALVWTASGDHGLVVESFSVPPDMGAKGLTGQVVASQVLDKLSAL